MDRSAVPTPSDTDGRGTVMLLVAKAGDVFSLDMTEKTAGNGQSCASDGYGTAADEQESHG
jgi:hypothetical protein